jgi:SSS family solute:Na+ symporter
MQKGLCAKNQDEGQKVFFLNGIFRFPLVLLYCLIGVGIGSYSQINTDFISSLPKQDGIPNFNLAVPIFLIENLPIGIVGLTLVALFSAAMSSLDSVLNSLSAVTMEDFVKRNRNLKNLTRKNNLFISRLITLFWGSLAIILAFYVEDISSNVLIAINKIGSLINGPIIGVFALGILTKKINGNSACTGIICGFLFNLYCWLYLGDVSWLWWNAIGFVVTFKIAIIHNFFYSKSQANKTFVWSLKFFKKLHFNFTWKTRYYILFIWSILIFCLINFL